MVSDEFRKDRRRAPRHPPVISTPAHHQRPDCPYQDGLDGEGDQADDDGDMATNHASGGMPAAGVVVGAEDHARVSVRAPGT